MNTPNEIINKLNQYEDITTAITLYKEILGIMEQYQEVKKVVLDFVQSHLEMTGESKGRTPVGTYGWTRPKSKRRLDTEAWREAVAMDPFLASLERSANQAQTLLEQAQEDFMVEEAGKSRVYVR